MNTLNGKYMNVNKPYPMAINLNYIMYETHVWIFENIQLNLVEYEVICEFMKWNFDESD